MQVTFGHQWVSSNKTDIDGGFYWVLLGVNETQWHHGWHLTWAIFAPTGDISLTPCSFVALHLIKSSLIGSYHVWCLAYHTDELNTEMWNTKKTPSKLHKATNLWLALVGGVIRKVAPASISGQRIWTHQTIGVTLNRCVLLIWENQHLSSTRERIWMHQQVLVLLLRYFAGVTLVSRWCYFCAQLSGAVWLACVGAWCSGAEEVTKSHAGALLFIALLACSLHVSTAACTLLDCTLACTGFP